MPDEQLTKKDFKVAVIGGGMCGLTLGIALNNAGIPVELYESAPKFGEVGVGVGIGPTAIKVLQSLGLYDAIITHSGSSRFEGPHTFVLGSEKGKTLKPIYDYPSKPEDAVLPIQRSVFQDALNPLLPSHLIHFSKRCNGVEHLKEKDIYVATFDDGTSIEADLIIGADGIRSAVRRTVFEKDPQLGGHLSFTGYRMYRGLVTTDNLKRHDGAAEFDSIDIKKKLTAFLGPDNFMVLYPLRGGSMLNVGTILMDKSITHPSPALPLPWVQPGTTADLLEGFSGWNDSIITVLKQLHDPSIWSIHHLDPPLETFVMGRIALVADAAHAMGPWLGAGAGQGFEDIFVLFKLLTHPQTNRTNLQGVLRAYDAVRRPRANGILKRTTEMVKLYHSYPALSEEDIKNRIVGKFDGIWEYDLEGDILKAVNSLRKDRVFE